MRRMICGLMALGFLAFPAHADEQGFIALKKEEIKLEPVPGMKGFQSALLYGDPNKKGFYVMRARFGPNVRTPPHFHDQDRFVTVISGTWHFGTGKAGTCEGTEPLGPGSFAMHPKGAVHYDGSCDGKPVVVEISGQGPVKTTWLKAK